MIGNLRGFSWEKEGKRSVSVPIGIRIPKIGIGIPKRGIRIPIPQKVKILLAKRVPMRFAPALKETLGLIK